MSNSLMKDLSLRARRDGLIVFAGAAVSVPPPSSLPDWNTFNEIVLDALARQLGEYTRVQYGEDVLRELVRRRNTTPHFRPEYQAQIIAEQCGVEYFRVLQALDTDEYNACHGALAALARMGLVSAIVTTNFDRLIEIALAAATVPHRVYYTHKEFSELAKEMEGGGPTNLPVIKVHGSVQAPESMVDTLQQRLMGRPESLESVLIALMRRHHVLFIGFSGADLDYDPHYLGLHQAAEDNRGFTCLYWSKGKPPLAMERLREAWGDAARLVPGELPAWTDSLVSVLGHKPGSMIAQTAIIDRSHKVAVQAREWATTLGSMQAVNILSALMEASGYEYETLELLRKIWRTYRAPEDCTGESYWRFNYKLGRLLLEYGELKYELADDAFQFLARAVAEGKLFEAYVELAVCDAYMGRGRDARDHIGTALRRAKKQKNPRAFADAALGAGTILFMTGSFSDALEVLQPAYQVVCRYGDEPRRARLCAHLARFLAWKERPEAARERLIEGLTIAERLGMDSVKYDLAAANGYLLLRQKEYQDAVEHLSQVVMFFNNSGRVPVLIPACLHLMEAAYFLNDDDTINLCLDLLREHLETLRGYIPHHNLLLAHMHHWNQEYDQATEFLELARQTSRTYQNEWVLKRADALEDLVRTAQGL